MLQYSVAVNIIMILMLLVWKPCTLPAPVLSQEKIDSLVKQLAKAKPDTQR